jgi:GntR family transcriptional regulator, carbon starvation induced regulator
VAAEDFKIRESELEEAAPRTGKGAETLASFAYFRLRREIITGQIPPGAKLHTRGLCERYEIGLSPVREALNRLCSDGLVRHANQMGFTVAPLSEQELDELIWTRCSLNETALRASMLRAEEGWEDGVVLSFYRLARIPRFLGDGSRNPVWEGGHRTYHASLVAGCGSRWLMTFCEQLYDASDRYRNLSPFAGQARPDHLEEHRALLDAIIAHDIEKACGLLRDHFERSGALIRKHLKFDTPGATTKSR